MRAAGGASTVGYTNMLMMLLKLRQAASHPWLVAGYGTEEAGGGGHCFALKLWHLDSRTLSDDHALKNNRQNA